MSDGLFDLDDDRDSKRSLTLHEKELLWERAKHKCEDCGKDIDFLEMQVGHDKAWSKGGRTTLKNTRCLCYRCNRLQGTDSTRSYMKKIGIQDKSEVFKNKLGALSLSQLRALAKDQGVKIRGRTDDSFFGEGRLAPSKRQYINKLKDAISQEDINKIKAAPAKKKKRRKSSDSWF